MSRFKTTTRAELVKKYGEEIFANVDSPSVPRSSVSQIGRGLGASLEGAALGLSKVSPGRLFLSKDQRRAVDENIKGFAPEPETRLERGAKVAGDIAQFFVPGPAGKVRTSTTGGSLASRVLSRAGGSRFLAGEAVKDVGISALQRPGQNPDEQISPVAEAGIGAAANILLPTAFSSVGDYLARIRTPNPNLKTVDDVLRYGAEINTPKSTPTAGSTPAGIRSQAENIAPGLRLDEQMIGISKSTKATLQEMDINLLKEYVDVTIARNNLATLPNGEIVPSALSYGNVRMEKAKSLLASKLQDTGSDIGQFREKIATIKVPNDSVKAVKSTLDDELAKLNLQFNKTGQVVQMPGKISKVSAGDINAIQGLADNYRIFSQSPTVENLIDLRQAFDSKIKFEKSAKNVSNEVDPLSRKLRATIAEINRQAVGKSQSALLERYSQLIDDLVELESYTERKAGTEFLMKLLLSERERQGRDLVKRLSDETGVNLFHDATAIKLVTEKLANADQKGLFKQEITGAGIDAVNFLSGDKVNFVGKLIQKGIEGALDEEAIILNAARKLE